MKIIVLTLLFLLSGCAVHRPLPPEETEIRQEFEAPGLTKEQIFERSRVWIERHLYSKGEIITLADAKAGVIEADGFIDYPARGEWESIERIQYTISFAMREDIKDSRISLTFYNLMLDIPKYYRYSRWWSMQEYTGGYSVPVEERSDFEAARRGMLDIGNRLEEYLKTGSP